MNLLGGKEIGEDEEREDTENAIGSQGGDRANEEKALDEKEIRNAVLRMKLKKAVGCDSISMEAWTYGGEAVQRGLVEVIRKVWKEGKIPKEWSKNIIVTLYKRGDVNVTGN